MLDAVDALRSHLDSIIVIGAQAIYFHTGSAQVSVAEATKDSDLAVDPRSLADHPLIERAMTAAGFVPNPVDPQPGSWTNARGVPVDLMVADALSGDGGRRGARIPPHGKRATRRARGLEAAMIDNTTETIRALDPSDTRERLVRVAGPAALLVAKTHKIAERVDAPHRLLDKDAHDLYHFWSPSTRTNWRHGCAACLLTRWLGR